MTAALLCTLVAGCGKPVEPQETAVAQAVPPASAAVEVKPSISVDQWRSAIRAAYTTKDETTDGQGVTEFLACFPGQSEKCPPFFKGQRDAFRKLTFFEPARSVWNESEYNPGAHLTPYVSLRDCGEPVLYLRASFRGESWLFMEKVAFLVDGEILLEHNFANEKVDRDTVRGGVQESANWRLDAGERQKLQKLVGAKSVAIRLTGQKGFVAVSQKETKDVVMDVGRVLGAAAQISTAVASLGGHCAAP